MSLTIYGCYRSRATRSVAAASPCRPTETYTMDHSAGMFVFDPQGRLRLFVSHGAGADALAHDLRQLLRGPG